MQRSLICQLIKDGQDAGVFRADLDPTNAAMCFVGMIQSIVLRGQLEQDPGPLVDEVRPMLSLWLDGARATPDGEPRTSHSRTEPERLVPSLKLASLDVRPILSGGTDPLDQILFTLATVQSAGVLTVTAPFRPVPLVRLLTERAHLVVVRQIGDGVWSLDIVVDGAPSIDELLDLEPPEPLERVLEATASLAAGETYIARLPRFPRPLVPHLSRRALEFEIAEADDGTALLHVQGRA